MLKDFIIFSPNYKTDHSFDLKLFPHFTFVETLRESYWHGEIFLHQILVAKASCCLIGEIIGVGVRYVEMNHQHFLKQQ